MINATNAAVIAIDEEGLDTDAVENLQSKLSLHGRRAKAKFKDISPTKEDGDHMRMAFQGLIAHMITCYCPGSENWDNHKDLLQKIWQSIPQDRPLPVKKTVAFPVGVFDVNEGSKKGVIKFLSKFRERIRLTVQEWASKVRIVCGDWLSANNLRAARHDRIDDIDSMEHIEYPEEETTLWHYGLQSTFMIIWTHLGNSAATDPTCLAAHKALLGRTWNVNEPNYAAAKALIRHSLIARLLHIVM